jgi:photosystem II stability/assembly factor-like uncharacterized protein
MKKRLLLLTLLLSNLSIAYCQTWSQLISPTNSDIKSCSFVSENVGWMITENSIYKTVDGGITWMDQDKPNTTQNIALTLNKIHFVNINDGIIACTNNISGSYNPAEISSVLWTNDGGSTWEFKDLGAGNLFFNDAKLVNSNTAYAIGNGGLGRKTVDGGQTWTTFNYAGNPNSYAYSLAVIDNSTVGYAGADIGFISYGAFGKTIDGGGVWSISNVSGFQMRSLYFTDSLNGWIAGNGGVIRKTSDGGTSWLTANVTGTGSVLGIAFTDNQVGWAVNADGEIMNSTDGGSNWILQFNASFSLNSISFSNNVGFAVGNSGTLLKYSTPLSLNSISEKQGFKVYPNPTNDLANITLDNVSFENSSISIFNELGQAIKKVEIGSKQSIILSRDNMTPGIYFIQLNRGIKKFTPAKLIIN